ncbi:MAG: phosphate acetyltransferase [Burkholderiales bacterium]|jgi:phosphate acetyltransferase|nr:phosphate acetyltransferase [Burkholderiales bacterium]
MHFLDSIKQRAKADLKTVVLPESFEPRNLQAAHTVLAEKLARIILIGDRKAIMDKAAELKLNVNLDSAEFIDPANYARMGELVDKLVEIRKSKGMTAEEATRLLREDPLYLGVMLVKEGIADGMVSGAIHATADVLRPSLQILKTVPGVKLVSSCFIMVVPDCEYGNHGTLLFSDCALVQNPTAEELSMIALSAAISYRQLVRGEPVVAMLSHSTLGSAKHADVDKVLEAVKLVKAAAPDLKVDGEFQLDTAIVPSIGERKAPGNPVAGKANVLVFPDLDSANIGYKLTERLAKAQAIGPITQGIAKPVNDLSRGCSAEDIVSVILITAAQAQGGL